jgi:asparagine synthase (glutamine-hydrolysing)
MTMAHAVEARVPYLDHRVVEFMYRLPSSLKLHGHTSKYLLRLLAERLLSQSTARRPKRGFTVPLAKWLHDREISANILSKDSIRRRGLFRVEPVRALVEKRTLDLFARRQLWALVCLEMWCRAFLDGNPVAPPGDTARTGGPAR